MTVALYARLSPKHNGSGYEGVDDQIAWGTTYAAKTWPGQPVLVFTDRGKSAGRDDVRREGFEDLRAAVRAGEVTHLWAVEQSRISRREIEWFTFATELDAAGISEVHTDRDGVVRINDEVSGIKAVLAASERKKMLRRQADTLAAKAAKGEPPGVRPFGYAHAVEKDGEVRLRAETGGVPEGWTRTYAVVPDQAEVIQSAAKHVLAGWSLASVAADLSERGVRGAHGGTVTSATVKSWLTSPSIGGRRVHSGDVVGDGNWPAILDQATFKAVGARLGGPRTVQRADGSTYQVGTAHQGNPGRRYLLTGGLAVCGVCNAPLVGSVKQLRNSQGVRSKPYLVCHPKSTWSDSDGEKRHGKACLGIMLPEVEEYVVETLFTHLDSPQFLEAVADDDHEAERKRVVAALEGIDGQRRELATMWGRGPSVLTSAEWQAAKAELATQEQHLNAELAAIPATSEPVDAATVREDWKELTLDEQRAFLRRYIARVTIRRATRHGHPGLDTERVVIDWAPAR